VGNTEVHVGTSWNCGAPGVGASVEPIDRPRCTTARTPPVTPVSGDERDGQDVRMDLALFSAKRYDRESFSAANEDGAHRLTFLDARLEPSTLALVPDGAAVCAFVNDDLGSEVIAGLAERGVGLIALRCAGFNHVDLEAAQRHGLTVARVPAYSPNAVAEHTLALILSLNRKIPRAYNRVRDGNFALDGLLGFDLAGKHAGVVGTGQIGGLVARLLWHLRCDVVAFDPFPDPALQSLGVRYAPLDEVVATSDVLSLNCPLTPETHHLIDAAAVAAMKPGVMLVNTGRGALIDTSAVIDGLKSGRIGSLALDVYEEESSLFFEDRSEEIILDDVFARLLIFPNVLITAHQAFFTHEALEAIALTTLRNVTDFEAGRSFANLVSSPSNGA
jgi:D-lactate dehydrogenase